MEAEEARGKRIQEVYREWFLSVYISYKSDQIRKKYFCRCSTVVVEIDCVRYCFLLQYLHRSSYQTTNNNEKVSECEYAPNLYPLNNIC